MSDSKARLLATLEVRRNALLGFGASAALTLATFVFFVVIPGSVHPTPYYLALAFVLASSLGALLTTVFVARTGRRVAAEQDSDCRSRGADHDDSVDRSDDHRASSDP
jgi:hypothetical protein